MDAAEGPPALNMQPALLGLQRPSREEGESPPRSRREVGPIGGGEAGACKKSPETASGTFFSPTQIPTVHADTTASSTCTTLTSQIKIGIF